MLSGIILQPGAWDKTEGILDEVYLANNTMQNVASPVTIWTKPGNPVGTITIDGLRAIGIYRSALSVESWSDLPITNVTVRNASITFAGGGTAEQGAEIVKGPGVDSRVLPAWGVYARKVETLKLENVRLDLQRTDLRPVIMAENIKTLVLDELFYDKERSPGTPGLVTTNVDKVTITENQFKRN
jgi:hypothetical protein